MFFVFCKIDQPCELTTIFFETNLQHIFSRDIIFRGKRQICFFTTEHFHGESLCLWWDRAKSVAGCKHTKTWDANLWSHVAVHKANPSGPQFKVHVFKTKLVEFLPQFFSCHFLKKIFWSIANVWICLKKTTFVENIFRGEAGLAAVVGDMAGFFLWPLKATPNAPLGSAIVLLAKNSFFRYCCVFFVVCCGVFVGLCEFFVEPYQIPFCRNTFLMCFISCFSN